MTIYWSRILEAWHILDGRPPGREQVTLGNAIVVSSSYALLSAWKMD